MKIRIIITSLLSANTKLLLKLQCNAEFQLQMSRNLTKA